LSLPMLCNRARPGIARAARSAGIIVSLYDRVKPVFSFSPGHCDLYVEAKLGLHPIDSHGGFGYIVADSEQIRQVECADYCVEPSRHGEAWAMISNCPGERGRSARILTTHGRGRHGNGTTRLADDARA
jgi:hypothetical protein